MYLYVVVSWGLEYFLRVFEVFKNFRKFVALSLDICVFLLFSLCDGGRGEIEI